VMALETDRTGVVDLASPDTVNVITAWRLLRSVDPRSRLHQVRGWPQLIPEMDISAVQEDWDFEFGWHAADAVADTARGLVGRRLGVAGATNHGSELALPVEVLPRSAPSERLTSAAPEGLEGEFDDRIDPRFPVFSATSLAEAFPGPLTPITLDVQLSGLRAASAALGEVLALGGVTGDEWGNTAVAVFGHRPYVGVSADVVAAKQLPGWNQQAVAERAVGDEAQVGAVAKAVSTARSLGAMRHLRADSRAYAAAAQAEHLAAEQLTTLPDAALAVRIPLLRDRIHQGWILTALWLIDTGVTAAVLQQTKAGFSVAGFGAIVESGQIAAETDGLAALLRADPPVCALAREGNLASVRALSPNTAGGLDAAIARIGHRGPGEAELASRMFGDDPALLLAAAATAAAAPAEPAAPATLPRRLAANARGSRDLVHDTTIWFTHELRMTLRELGSRWAAKDLVDAAEHVYFLTCDELVAQPADARLRIKRRRAERERLQAQRPPDVIDTSWIPLNGNPDCPASPAGAD
jgi:hypothetical protein